jgi:hypothetical protein
MPRTSNSACRRYVEECLPFLGNNLSAVWKAKKYIVYSYGPHWPLFIYEQATDTWYANRDKYSQSTSRHYSQANPSTYNPEIKPVPLSAQDMHVVRDYGSVGLIAAANERLET